MFQRQERRFVLYGSSRTPARMQGFFMVECVWNLMAHGDARGGEVKGKLANGLGSQYSDTTSEHGVSSITTADAHPSAASSQLNWRPRRFKWTRPFRREAKSGFCACAITFQTHYTSESGGHVALWPYKILVSHNKLYNSK